MLFGILGEVFQECKAVWSLDNTLINLITETYEEKNHRS
jgi:hypothetical protein